MNILYIAHDLNINGATLSLLGLIDELNNYDDINNIYVVIKNKQGELENELKKRNIKVIKAYFFDWMIEVDKKNKFKLYFEYILKNIINILTSLFITIKIKKLDIDIIHSNSSVINIGGFISKLSGIPHVWHIREFGEEDHNLVFPLFNRKCYRFIDKNSKKVIAISKSVYNKYSRLIDKNNMCVIYNGVDIKYINKKENFNTEKVRILMAGSIKKNKGQESAIKAAKNLVDYGVEFELLILGSGEKEYIEKLKNDIINYKIEKYVKIKSFVKNLENIRQESDIELICSKKEAFGRVTVEAMLSMNIVVGSDTGGTKELIRDGFNGILYEQGNEKDLTEKLKIIIENINDYRFIGINGFNYAKEKFLSSINAKNIYQIYDYIKN
ncbi:glycosyltransferase [Clostridium perfringens]|nr:glycosyltransferase [Clostridium perfringens]EHK2442953.1 glycosyltransferase [Clostridium perfringens]